MFENETSYVKTDCISRDEQQRNKSLNNIFSVNSKILWNHLQTAFKRWYMPDSWCCTTEQHNIIKQFPPIKNKF